jgi:segregation and condensation protein B
MSLEQQIEAILFWKAEPLSVKKLAEVCGRNEGEIQDTIIKLEQNLMSTGVRLLRKNDEVLLGAAPEASELIEKLTREELSRDLGKAGLETLSIVLYQGPITRAGIDYIRGVNSSFILRHLQIRDLVEKIIDPSDARRFLYRPTFNLLQHLGVTKVEDLPEYGTLEAELQKLSESKLQANS